ncbi:MAG: DUF2235 domain-containing protein [Methylomonas sp.]|jgi:uncharacterized protein (DUF2235 family)|uniref:DUF2235 domain-containing protein n=1 Tax=Methylomonas sp. TaxID=418 RepID=UPI0025D0E193|nr:DUF2235 domain-containing protein [Methylomonas sp.]MCK9606164.1 DUF2235 domain-containing protein [Methylomonas sp.]
MSKNIILLSDGTGNSNIKKRGTNVFKMYEAIDYNKLHGPADQVAFYDDGVGTQEFKPLKIMGGAFGWGLARNVRNLYKRLVQVYVPGDKIYLFGFSRGAFTIRTLAGLITNNGILDNDKYPTDEALELAVLQLYEGYRAQNAALLEKVFYTPLMKGLFNAFGGPAPDVHPGKQNRQIEFVGVWDTVDAVGLPFDWATDQWDKWIFRFTFPDHELHPNIKQACHALSIDDERLSFHPLLWRQEPRIEQVWFPGVHSNVGGGYPQQGISLVVLDWMINKAEAAGVQFIPYQKAFVQDQKFALDKLYDSRSGVGVYYQYQPRDIADDCRQNNIDIPQIHVSAFQRIADGVFGYAPGNLPNNFQVVDNDGPHPNSAAILATVNPAGPSSVLTPLLLEAVRGDIRKRHGIYYTFLAYSGFVLYRLMQDDIQKQGFLYALRQLVAPDSLLEKLGSLLWSEAWLTGIGLIIVGVAVKARGGMANKFSVFWSDKRTKIQTLL